MGRWTRFLCLASLGTFKSGILDKRQTGALAVQKPLEMFAQILDQMVPIRDLRGMRQDLAHRIRKGTGPIPADYLNFWVRGEPGLDRFSGTVGQEIEGAPCLDVNQNRAICVCPPDGLGKGERRYRRSLP
jgi:hypothetical protein